MLFAHFKSWSGCVVHAQCGLHDGGMMEGVSPKLGRCALYKNQSGHWFSLGRRGNWCVGPYSEYTHTPIRPNTHTLTDTAAGRGPKTVRPEASFLTCRQAHGCKKLNKNLARFGFWLDLQLSWYSNVINGLYFGLLRTIIFPRILSCLGFIANEKRGFVSSLSNVSFFFWHVRAHTPTQSGPGQGNPRTWQAGSVGGY